MFISTKQKIALDAQYHHTLVARLEALTEAQELVYKHERENGASVPLALSIAEEVTN